MMTEDDLTLTPVYRFLWEDGTVRVTDDHDVLYRHVDGWSPDAVEALAQMGREDPDCTVELLGMSG